MNNSRKTSRRNFVKLATATTLLAGQSAGALSSERTHTISSGLQTQQPVSPNNKIRLATIGHGIIGTIDTATALRVPGVEMVAVADVYDGRFVRAKELYGNQIFTTRDYRELLARPDIDAVIVATPDHWHAQMAVDAMEAGKDVYCEKPMVHTLEEGHRIIEAQQKTKRVLQVGSQFASSIVYQKAKELLAAGAIGELNMIEAAWNRNSALGAWQYHVPPDATPANVDWDRFLGKAPKRPFEPVRLFRWRNYRDYGTAVAGDLFVHLFTGVHYVVGSMGPTRVMSLGGLRHWKDGRDVPDVMLGIYEYPKTTAHTGFNLSLSVNFIAGGGSSSILRLTGSEGVMVIDSGVAVMRRGVVEGVDTYAIPSFPLSVQETYQKDFLAKYPQAGELNGTSENRYVAPGNYDARLDHFRNFFDSMRTRKALIEDAVFGFRAAGPALLTNQSYYDNRPFTWNPETMKVVSE